LTVSLLLGCFVFAAAITRLPSLVIPKAGLVGQVTGQVGLQLTGVFAPVC
jgi:hypothetical protein